MLIISGKNKHATVRRNNRIRRFVDSTRFASNVVLENLMVPAYAPILNTPLPLGSTVPVSENTPSGLVAFPTLV
jgi:hypothetical protein